MGRPSVLFPSVTFCSRKFATSDIHFSSVALSSSSFVLYPFGASQCGPNISRAPGGLAAVVADGAPPSEMVAAIDNPMATPSVPRCSCHCAFYSLPLKSSRVCGIQAWRQFCSPPLLLLLLLLSLARSPSLSLNSPPPLPPQVNLNWRVSYSACRQATSSLT